MAREQPTLPPTRTRVSTAPEPAPFAAFSRYVPLLVWVIVILGLLLIPSKIISYGFLPADDALRHAAKAVSGKPWSEILVMRPDFNLDPHPGWHAVLGFLRRSFQLDAERLVVLSIVSLMLLVSAAVLPWLRRPESWTCALLFGVIFVPAFAKRLALGRPYLFTMACALVLLALWSRLGIKKPKAGA